MAESKTLSASEMDQIFHHFTEEIVSRDCLGVDSWTAVQECHETLRVIKSRSITEQMNLSVAKSVFSQNKSFNPGSVPGHTRGVGSLVVATIVNNSCVANNLALSAHIEKVPTHLKIAASVHGIKHAANVIPEILQALLIRDNIWQDSRDLKEAVFHVTHSSNLIPPISGWTIASDGKSISVHTLNGLLIKCAHLHNNKTNMAREESDQTFARRTMCQRVTQTYSSQPLVVSVNCVARPSQMLKASVYPCSKSSSGILMATTHLSGYERPLRSCALVVPCSLRRHVNYGVHEADVSALIAPFVRTHTHTIAALYSKCALMKVVLQDAAPVFLLPRLGDMDELELHTQYTRLRGLCTPLQLKSCASTWSEMQASDAVTVTCISGTINAFENDKFHTDVATHTHSIMDTTFTHEGQVHHVSSPLIVSLYGTYYHHT
jgi:hypothetical protein